MSNGPGLFVLLLVVLHFLYELKLLLFNCHLSFGL